MRLRAGARARSGHPAVLCEPAPPAAVIHEARYEDYTRYELLAPETAQFKIQFETSATTPGATAYFNPIRKGSEATDERVFDLATGEPLPFEVVTGAEARETGLPDADLGHAVHPGGPAARPFRRTARSGIFIEKTYRDPKSYFRGGRHDRLRPLARRSAQRGRAPGGLRGRLPATCPSQVLTEPDGRIEVSFVNSAPDAASLVLKARRLAP